MALRRASRGVQIATLATLLAAGLLAPGALGSSYSARAQTGTTTVDSDSHSVPDGVWMTFEANPASSVLRPLRKFAACVRRHGIAGLPDPKVVNGKVVLMLPHALTSKSQRLESLQRACQSLLPQGPSTQPGIGTGPHTRQPGSR